MILDFGSFIINESSLKKLKKDVHGVLNMSARKRMRRELRDNIITFKFKKRNGETRTAHGTLHPDYLPPLKGGAPRPERQMVYYDLDKEGWRSFRSYAFIKILNIKPVNPDAIPTKHHSKPVKSEEEDEKIKKTSHIEKEEEKEVKKPVPKKKEVEDEEEHEYKSPIYDETKDEKKEREEDDEKIEKIKHKGKEEHKEDTEEDKDKDKEKDEEKKSEDE